MSEYALPPLLSTQAVAERYGCGACAARRIMHEAGALAAAGRLLVRADALDAWERTHIHAVTESAKPNGNGRRRRGGVDPRQLSRLDEGWWRMAE
jgi:hypothetical protein